MSASSTPTPPGTNRNKVRDRVVADAVIRLIEARVLAPRPGERMAHLMVRISCELHLPMRELRDAWRRIDTGRQIDISELVEAV